MGPLAACGERTEETVLIFVSSEQSSTSPDRISETAESYALGDFVNHLPSDVQQDMCERDNEDCPQLSQSYTISDMFSKGTCRLKPTYRRYESID